MKPTTKTGTIERRFDLTERQRAAYDFIVSYMRRTRGHPPSVRQIGHSLGISKPGAGFHVRALMAKGYLQLSRFMRGTNSMTMYTLVKPIDPVVEVLPSGMIHVWVMDVDMPPEAAQRLAGRLLDAVAAEKKQRKTGA